ncbi:MAG: GntR family transcriptional regulator [Planctomycetaceae bacterium]
MMVSVGATTSGKVSKKVEHGQRRRAVVEDLLADIFQGRIKAGEHLVINSLARRFGMSPTPIREALVTLEGIGIVDIAPNCGAVVRRVTETDVREVCQVRRALECAAVRLACGRTDLSELRQLEAACRRQSAMLISEFGRDEGDSTPDSADDVIGRAIEVAREVDSRLHDLIADSCGNRFLTKELGRLKLLFRTFRDVAWDRRSQADLPRFAEEAREHLAVIEALLAGDATAASKAMTQHIRSGLKYWSRGLPK